MPELPEVETTLRGIYPSLLGQQVTQVILRQTKLRWPIPSKLKKILLDQTINSIRRRGKYLLLDFAHGTLILHLGMSGRLRILSEHLPPKKHDHADFHFSNGILLRLTDPRRFGAILWSDNPDHHPLLRSLGPEPLTDAFDGTYLTQRAKGRKLPVKSFIMDSRIVTGVGNIYAAEALFRAGIHPGQAAGAITLKSYAALAQAIKQVLQHAIKKGGTTLKDFMKSDGSPGYFSIELQVYGRGGEPCVKCGQPLAEMRIGQRSTVFCKQCQR